MKRVGVQYVIPDPYCKPYAYDVPHHTKVGDIVIDQHDRVAIVTVPDSRWEGETKTAYPLREALRICRTVLKPGTL